MFMRLMRRILLFDPLLKASDPLSILFLLLSALSGKETPRTMKDLQTSNELE